MRQAVEAASSRQGIIPVERRKHARQGQVAEWDAQTRALHQIGSSIAHSPDALSSSPRADHPRAFRAFERVAALLALILSAPLMAIIALVIKLDSPGPALFFQQRLGAGGKPFRFVKFRTMRADSRERFPQLYTYQYDSDKLSELRFKVENDPRVTGVGAWLRQSSLDELPNFWNVLTGDMALVGPRPEIPEMLPYYKGAMLEKFSVRPGITGLAQISGRGRLKFYDTVAYDLRYVRERSVRTDLVIILKTIKKVCLRHGAF